MEAMEFVPAAVPGRGLIRTSLEWLGAVDHKKIGILHMLAAGMFFLIAGGDSMAMRSQLVTPLNGLVGPVSYMDLLTTHGTAMMLLFALPLLQGLATYVTPLMLGTRRMPHPRLTAFAFWLYLAGGAAFYSSVMPDIIDIVVGDGTVQRLTPYDTWVAYTPNSLAHYSPGPNFDFYLAGIGIAGLAAMITAAELIWLIVRRRSPGMTWARLPLFAWSTLVASIMTLPAFAVLLAGLVLLGLARNTGLDVFAGNATLWLNLFWAFANPLDYIYFIFGAGILFTIVPVFSRRPVAARRSVAGATVVLAVLAFLGWPVHMTTAGIPGIFVDLAAAATALTALPAGIWLVSWLTTLWQGRVEPAMPQLFALTAIVLIVLAGVSGVMLTAPDLDRQLHNSYMVAGYFHLMLFGAVVFPATAGLYYWLPKVTGKMLNHRLGVLNLVLLTGGTLLTFVPMYILGLLGMPRQIYTYQPGLGWDLYNVLATAGGYLLALSAAVFLADVALSLATGADAGRDPWLAGTLEWATASPPSAYNFREIPVVRGAYPLWAVGEEDAGAGDAGVARPAEEDEEHAPAQGPSLLPLGAATGLAMLLAGLAFTLYPLAIAGAILAAPPVGLWIITRRRGLPLGILA